MTKTEKTIMREKEIVEQCEIITFNIEFKYNGGSWYNLKAKKNSLRVEKKLYKPPSVPKREKYNLYYTISIVNGIFPFHKELIVFRASFEQLEKKLESIFKGNIYYEGEWLNQLLEWKKEVLVKNKVELKKFGESLDGRWERKERKKIKLETHFNKKYPGLINKKING